MDGWMDESIFKRPNDFNFGYSLSPLINTAVVTTINNN